MGDWEREIDFDRHSCGGVVAGVLCRTRIVLSICGVRRISRRLSAVEVGARNGFRHGGISIVRLVDFGSNQSERAMLVFVSRPKNDLPN